MSRTKFGISSLATAACVALALAGHAAAQSPFTAGNVVIVRVGDGVATLSSAAHPVFLDEYTVAGALVQTIALPTTTSGSVHALTNSGSATSEGFLNLSADGQYLVHAGYDAAPGTAAVVSTASGASPRVVARIDLNGVVDTSTAVTDAYSGNNIRSATSNDGLEFWIGGTASTTGGVRYVANVGASSSTQLATTPTNVRVVAIFGGQLYTSSASGAFVGVNTVGTGLPSTSGQTIALLGGFSGTSTYDYFFADASTLYVADDGAGGGIQKWTLSAGAWSKAYTLAPSGTTCRGLTGTVDAAGLVTLYATTSSSAPNSVVAVTDTGAASTFTSIATAGTNTVFRGIRLLPVPQMPSITTQPAGASVCVGSAASLSVVASGAAPLTFQWTLDGVAIPGAASSTYSVASAAVADGGTYECTVSNGYGTVVSDAAVLAVNDAPTITGDPTGASVNSGAPVGFSVTTSSVETPTYQWRKDGTDLSGENASSLSIAAVAIGDAGSYDCVVTTSCGTATSAAAVLTVTQLITITTQPGSVTGCAGTTASFSVVASGAGPLSYQWRKDGASIAGATSTSYAIVATTAADAGAYDVVVSNASSSTTSDPAVLVVNEAPAVTGSPSPLTVCAGDGASFSVFASGTAPLSFQWRKNHAAISGATGSSFSIASTVAGDAASYDCVVTNGCGSATSASAALAVNSAPSIVVQPAGGAPYQGSTFYLVVAATGTGPLAYQWRRDGADIPGETYAFLPLSPVRKNDAATYDVVVSNACGTATSAGAVVTVTPFTLAMTQPGGAGSLKIAASGGPASGFYFTVLTFDPSNGTSPGTGFFFGLHTTIFEVTQEFAFGVAPFVGFLDSSGASNFSLPGGTIGFLAGATVYAETIVFDPSFTALGAASDPASLVIQ